MASKPIVDIVIISSEENDFSFELPITSRSINGGRDFTRFRYPHLDGQDTADTGGKPLTFSVSIPFYSKSFNREEPLYPGKYNEFLSMLNDPSVKGEFEYSDRIVGRINVKLSDWNANEDSSRLDFATITMELEQRHLGSHVYDGYIFTDSEVLGDTASELDQQVTESDDFFNSDIASSGTSAKGFYAASGLTESIGAINNEATYYEQSFVAQAKSLDSVSNDFASTIEDSLVIAENIDSRADMVLGQTPAWEIAQAAYRLKGSLHAERAKLRDLQNVRARHVVTVATNIYDISMLFFGTADRAQDILIKNKLSDPLNIKAGEIVLIPQ